MLISILGDVGTGKTLLATFLAMHETKPIFANYKLKLPNFRPLQPEKLIKIDTGALIILDEAYTWIESRLSGRSINLFSTYILFQSRKRGYDIVMTDQLESTIDVRFRQMTNIEIHCELTPLGFKYHILRKSRYRDYRPHSILIPFSVAEKVYPIYDSWQPVETIDEDLVFKITKDRTDIIKEVDSHAKKIAGKMGKQKVTRGVIADYCLRTGLPKSWVDLIHNSIQARQARVSK